MRHSSYKQGDRKQGLLDAEQSAVVSWKDDGSDPQGKGSQRKKGQEKIIPLFLYYLNLDPLLSIALRDGHGCQQASSTPSYWLQSSSRTGKLALSQKPQ